MKRSRLLWVRGLGLWLAVVALIGAPETVRAADTTADLPPKTALDDYIAKPDTSYKWSVAKTVKSQGLTVFVVDMTSQTWRTPAEVNRPVWTHWLIVAKPDGVKYRTGMLVIGGGDNNGKMPDPADSLAIQLAQATGGVVAELLMVPNQPLIFHNDGKPREEDDLVAYTWDMYMKTGDPTWPARNPMIKSAVRAMDTMQALMASEEGGKLPLEKFVVAGGSKRGWTTWLTGALDKRVVAIVPVVIDVLNCEKSLRHHYAAYGFWAPAIDDYQNHKILQRMCTPEAANLFKLVDPYSYRHRLTMPKYIVAASGDQFFLPDSSRFYFDDLVGEKYLRSVPNTDHGLDNTDAMQTIAAFHKLILDGKPRPQFSWEFESEGLVHVRCKDQPAEVKLWTATNPDARDFRIESLGPKYRATVLKEQRGEYLAKVDKPSKGWTAWFVELTYPVGKLPLKLTTPVRVIPDVCPFAEKLIPGTQVKAGQ